MPRINKQETVEHVELPIIEGHDGPVGDFTVGFERYYAERTSTGPALPWPARRPVPVPALGRRPRAA